MFGSGFGDEQHVIAKHDLHGPFGRFGSPVVKRGSRGIVRSRPGGLLDSRYTVEFDNGRRLRVRAGDLRRGRGLGQESWRRRQEWRTGMHLGLLLVIGLPLVWTLIRYYAAGRDTSHLIAALPGAFATTCLQILNHAVSALGVPGVLILLSALWVHRRLRSR